jgi:hypothetical protein
MQLEERERHGWIGGQDLAKTSGATVRKLVN